MSYTRSVKRRIVLTTQNKENFFKILNEVLKKHGLEGEAIKDLQPGPTQSIATVKDHLQSHGVFLDALKSLWGTKEAYILEPFSAKVDKLGAGFIDQYTLEWIQELTTHADKDAKDIMTDAIDSVRVLIFETLCRIFIQAVRLDGKLPTGKNRSIWIEILNDLNIELLTVDQLNKVGLDTAFHTTLITLQGNWLHKLKSVMSRLDDLTRSKDVFAANLGLGEEQLKQTMRFIIAEEVDQDLADRGWGGSLDSLPMLMYTLENVETYWITKYKKDHHIDDLELIMSSDATSLMIDQESVQLIDKSNKVLQFTFQDVKLVRLGALTKEQAARQQFIVSHAQNDRLSQLYALYNSLLVIDQFEGHLGDLIEAAGLTPMLLEKMKFEPFDEMLQTHMRVFEQLMNFTFLKRIDNTNLYRNLLVYVAKASKLEFTPLHKFKQLTDEVFLRNIKTHIGGALQGIVDCGHVMGCSVTQALPASTLSGFLTGPRASASPDISGASGSSALKSPAKTHSLMGYQFGSDQLLLLGSGVNPLDFHYPPMRVPYIINLFHHAKLINCNHMVNFEDDQFFIHSSDFLLRIRNQIREFDTTVLRIVVKPETLGGLTRDYWYRRDEEVYWGKYLVVQAALTGDIKTLMIFLNELCHDPYISPITNIPAWGYDKLPKGILLILNEARQNPGMLLLQGSKEEEFLLENQQLHLRQKLGELILLHKDKEIKDISAQHEQKVLELATQHQKEVAAIKEEAEKEIKKRDVEIGQHKAEIEQLKQQGTSNSGKIEDLFKQFGEFKTSTEASRTKDKAEMEDKHARDIKVLEDKLKKQRDEDMKAAGAGFAEVAKSHESDFAQKEKKYKADLEKANAEILRLKPYESIVHPFSIFSSASTGTPTLPQSSPAASEPSASAAEVPATRIGLESAGPSPQQAIDWPQSLWKQKAAPISAIKPDNQETYHA